MVPLREAPSAMPRERRRYRRYPVNLSIRYRLSRDRIMWEEGLGATRDLSSEGVSFRADRNLPVGADVELQIDWPVKINGVPGLCAVILGRILRSHENEIAVAILQSEFQMNRQFGVS